MSNYKEEQARSLQEIENDMQNKAFTERFKPMIENGLTREDFISQYAVNEADLQRFDSCLETVQREAKEAELFMQGFNSVKPAF